MRFLNFFVYTVVIVLVVGCASTTQTKGEVSTSGFLGDYSQLKPGEEGQAQLVYVNPAADFSKYNRILMEPIYVYASEEGSSLSKMSKEDLQTLVDYLDSAVREQLKADYTFVEQPEPATMRLRIAITEARGANVALGATSTVLPVGMAVSALKQARTGAHTGAARAGIEMELTDAQTGERLAAAVDERAGGKLASFEKWRGVKEAYDYWAKTLRVRLAQMREKKTAGTA